MKNLALPPHIILFDSDEAAKFVTNIKGWVSSTGRFFGDDEDAARYAGCTHKICSCGNVMEKHFVMCLACHDKKGIDDYASLPKKAWNGSNPLYSRITHEFYHNLSDVLLALSEFRKKTVSGDISSLQLVICDPIFPHPLDPYVIYEDDIGDFDLPPSLEDAFLVLNESIASYKIPISWTPGKYAFDPNFVDKCTSSPSSVITEPSSPDFKAVHFFSNHKDTSFLEKYFPDRQIVIIPHPLLKPDWSEGEVRIHCSSVISRATKADTLIINGEYFLVAHILKSRMESGKSTGFISFEKLNQIDTLSSNGAMPNHLKPFGVRWIHAPSSNNDWNRIRKIFEKLSQAGLSAGIGFSPLNQWEAWTSSGVTKVSATSPLAAMELLLMRLKTTNHLS